MARYNRNNNLSYALSFFGFLYIIFWIVFGIGWIMNLVKLIHMISDPITLLAVLRGFGLFVPPIGALLGLFF